MLLRRASVDAGLNVAWNGGAHAVDLGYPEGVVLMVLRALR
jgi:hypothetical protein